MEDLNEGTCDVAYTCTEPGPFKLISVSPGGGGTAPAVNVTSNSNVVQDNIFETVSILYLKLRDSVFCLVSSDTF